MLGEISNGQSYGCGLSELPLSRRGSLDQRTTNGFGHENRSLTLCVLVVITSLILSSFPGEPHLNLLTGHAWSSVQCKRLLLDFIGLRFDRLGLPRRNIVDGEKLEKIQGAREKAAEQPFQGAGTKILRDRI
jgi:hypothetical protein